MVEKKMTLSRRNFLKVSALAGVATASTAGLAGCGLGDTDAQTTINSNVEGVTIVPTAGRNNCGGCCVIKAHVKDGNIVKLSTDDEEDLPDKPQVRACVRGRGYRKTFLNADRLKVPMKRVGERGEGLFEEITWEEAIDTIVSENNRIKEAYGPESRYVNYAWGYSGAIHAMSLAKRLLALDGGYLEFYNTYSSACTTYSTPYIYGSTTSGNGNADWVNSKLIILWGHNPAENIFGSHSNLYLRKAKEAGAKIIVVDPRYSDTAVAYADEWVALKPTSDVALLSAMAYVIYTEGLHDQEFLDKFCIGFDEEHMPEGVDSSLCYRAYIMGEQDGILKTPEWASSITGVTANKITQLAIDYASIKPAALIQGYGPQRHEFGEQPVLASAVLACMTGNVGISGGGGAAHGGGTSHSTGSMPSITNPYDGKIPCYAWTQAMNDPASIDNYNYGLTGVDKLEYGIKMMWNMSGQCMLNQHGDINATMDILKDESKCEFIVCSDIFMTPTAKFADILLPGTSMFEEDNIRGPWGKGEYTCRLNQAIEPLFDCKSEYYWMMDVAEKLGIKEEFTDGHETMYDWCETIYNTMRAGDDELPDFETFNERGIYKWSDAVPYIAFKSQIEDFENNPFSTPSGKIEIFSERLYEMNRPDDIPPVPKYLDGYEGPTHELAEKYPLQMIGWHVKRRCHSTHDNNEWMEEAEPQTIWINTDDATARGINHGDMVEVYNDRGIVHVTAHVTNRIMPGVTAISQGGWYTPDSDGVDTRGAINVLTHLKLTPLAKGNAQHTNLVEVKLV